MYLICKYGVFFFLSTRLLTPPGTPTVFPSSEGSESQPILAAPRSSSLARSASTTKASRVRVTTYKLNLPGQLEISLS